jgi:septum formation inhibitor-activating ATPase MinD
MSVERTETTTIAVTNQKGGVRKTTATISIADLAETPATAPVPTDQE